MLFSQYACHIIFGDTSQKVFDLKKHPKHFYMLNLGPYPVTAIFAPSGRSYRRALKRYGISTDIDDGSYPDSSAQVAFFEPRLTNIKNDLCIVTVDLDADVQQEQICGIVAHECAHIFQRLCKHIGEQFPSDEFMAYTIQSLTQDVLFAISDFRDVMKERDKRHSPA